MRIALASLLLASALASPAWGGLSAESVAVVANGDSWASLLVANEYCRNRGIDPSHIVVLHGLSSFDLIDVRHFREEVLGPALAALEARGLAGQIDCLSYSLDVPCAVVVSEDMQGGAFPQVITPVASTNSLTYLHDLVMAKDPGYLALDVNRYMRRTLPVVASTPLTREEQAAYRDGMRLYDEKKYAEAAQAIAGLLTVERGDAGMLYNLACCQSLAKQEDAALGTLRKALLAGWRNAGQAAGDADFAAVRERPEFQRLLEEMRRAPVEVQRTRGFRAESRWNTMGEPSGGPSEPRYLLSTMLGVASGRGNSVQEVLACLERAVGADGSAPRGTIYCERNGDVRSTTREWAFARLPKDLAALGVACVVEDGVLPTRRADVAGAVIGSAVFDWTSSGSTILPGAICEHLTSCGGMMGEADTQTPCTDLIRAGAAGSSGAVTEPYALQEKFPSPFLHLHYARGSTLAEAFYQSVHGPYQLLIIGDPLCAPWAVRRTSSVSGVKEGAAIRGAVELAATIDGDPRVRRSELFVDGRRVGAVQGKPAFRFDTADVADGPHVLSLVATLDDAAETRCRTTVGVEVANRGGPRVELEREGSGPIAYGQPLVVHASCAGAASIELLAHGESVARMEGASGSARVDSRLLGPGPTRLEAVAITASGSNPVRAKPLAVETRLPDPATAPAAPVAGRWEPGLSLVVGDAAPRVVADLVDPAWLGKAGVKTGDGFELSGWFEVPAAELHQLQLRANLPLEVAIDGAVVLGGATEGWRYVPVPLAAGKHRLGIKGVATAEARIDLRFGGKGTRHPAAAAFSRPLDSGR